MFISGNEPDFILLNEVIPKAQLHPISPALLSVPGYVMYLNFDPSETKLGSSGIRGVCIYAKSSLRVSEVVFKDSTFREQLWIEMPLASSDVLLLGCIYRSPSGSAEEDLNKIGSLFKQATNSRYTHVVIGGDFNLPQINWQVGLSSAPP